MPLLSGSPASRPPENPARNLYARQARSMVGVAAPGPPAGWPPVASKTRRFDTRLALTRRAFPHSPFVPRTVEDWLEHEEAVFEMKRQRDAFRRRCGPPLLQIAAVPSKAGEDENCYDEHNHDEHYNDEHHHDDHRRGDYATTPTAIYTVRPALDGRPHSDTLPSPHLSPVLSLPTIWRPNLPMHPLLPAAPTVAPRLGRSALLFACGWRHPAPWPDAEEAAWEGDERRYGRADGCDFGRFLPCPRAVAECGGEEKGWRACEFAPVAGGLDEVGRLVDVPGWRDVGEDGDVEEVRFCGEEWLLEWGLVVGLECADGSTL